jgi:choline dehydrogenase-like flavoprotein
MIADLQKITEYAEIRGKIAIIGGGAAGITLAIELAKHFKDVLLLESGGFEFEQQTQNLYAARNLGLGHPDLISSRLRYLGGTTNHWGGQCAPLDSVDFERIAARPYSGWPFTLEDLMPYYKRAYAYCQLGTFRQKPVLLDKCKLIARQIVDSPEFVLSEFRHSPPTRFGEHFGPALRSPDRIKVFLHANVTDISMAADGNSVSFVTAKTLTGRKAKVIADAFVLCCGGVENARILLNNTRHFPNGIGNEHDLVGRFFMERLGGGAGYISPSNQNFKIGPMAYRGASDGDVPISMVLRSSDESVRRTGAGWSIFFHPEFENTAFIDSKMQSPAFEAFKAMVQDMKKGHIPRDLEKRSLTALDDLESIVWALYYRMTNSFRDKGALKTIFVRMEGEQLPNPNSRIILIDEVDALGMKRVGANWRYLPRDVTNINDTAMAVARGVGAAGFGRMLVQKFDEHTPIGTNWHQMGTTRMHSDKRQGVVDQNCRVHGLANFFIAGSSVFPTGGRVNPTLTIVALAIRLGDHLKLAVKNA